MTPSSYITTLPSRKACHIAHNNIIITLLNKDGGNLLGLLLIETLNLLQLLSVFVDDDGGGGLDVEECLGGWVGVNVDLEGLGVVLVFLASSVVCQSMVVERDDLGELTHRPSLRLRQSRRR